MVANSMEGLVKNVPTVLRSSWRPMVSPRAFSVTKKACQTTPIDKDETVTVIFDEIRGKVLAEEWEREATKLFPHDWLPSLGWGLLRLRHRGRLPSSYLHAAC